MKQASLTQKSARSIERKANQSAAGPNGIAMAPPTYGIDLVDRQPVQAVLAPSQESQLLQSPTGSIQKKSPAASPGSNSPAAQQENKTGLPDKLKTGVETLSGLAMDDVKVHYNSTKPAQLKALAYTQGTNIHVGRGQERHLPHEAWHVVQQKQRRVKPTRQMNGKVKVNDDLGLEKEAEVMGRKALRQSPPPQAQHPATTSSAVSARGIQPQVAQRTRSGELATVVQCQPAISKEDLISLLTSLSENKDNKNLAGYLKKLAIVPEITKYLEKNRLKAENLREPQFAWDLMTVINQLSFGQQITMQDTDIVAEDYEALSEKEETIYQQILGYKWALRHYTASASRDKEPPFDFISSNAELMVAGIGGKNTRDKDWGFLGNTGFVFFLLTINNQVPKRGFLDQSTHYAEYDISDISSSLILWLSGDLLKENKDTIKNATAYKGSGKNVKALLARKLAIHFVKQDPNTSSVTPELVLDVLENHMKMDNLEVKIPGGLSVNRWIKK